MGKRKIAIEKIENKEKRYVTFTKRRQGLFKKAATASNLFGLQIGMIVFSPAGKPYIFSSNSSSVDSIIDRFMSDSSSVGKRSRSDGGDDIQVNETAEKKKKRKTMMMNTTTPPIREEEEKDEGFDWDHHNKNLDSDHQTDHQELTNEFMGFGGNAKKQGIITEEIMESQGREEEETDVPTTTTWNMNEFLGFDSSLLLSPPPPVAAVASSSSSSEFLVEGDNYSWPSDVELQEIMNLNGLDNDADHHHHHENMCLLPPPSPPTTTSLSNSSMNQEVGGPTSLSNSSMNQEVGGDADGPDWATMEEWELFLS